MCKQETSVLGQHWWRSRLALATEHVTHATHEQDEHFAQSYCGHKVFAGSIYGLLAQSARVPSGPPVDQQAAPTVIIKASPYLKPQVGPKEVTKLTYLQSCKRESALISVRMWLYRSDCSLVIART